MGIPVALILVLKNHWAVFTVPKHWVSALTTWKSTFLEYRIHKQRGKVKLLCMGNGGLASGEPSALTSSPQRGSGGSLVVRSALVRCSPLPSPMLMPLCFFVLA